MFDFKRLVVGDELKLGRRVYRVKQIRPTADGGEAVLFSAGALHRRIVRVAGNSWYIASARGVVITRGTTP